MKNSAPINILCGACGGIFGGMVGVLLDNGVMAYTGIGIALFFWYREMKRQWDDYKRRKAGGDPEY